MISCGIMTMWMIEHRFEVDINGAALLLMTWQLPQAALVLTDKVF